MEFPDDRNTSAESIIASKETFVRFMDIFCADTNVEVEEGQEETKRVLLFVQATIFVTDNVDMYEQIYIGIFSKGEETENDQWFLRTIWSAVKANSIQIMKHIISNDETLSKMKEIDAPDQDEDVEPVKIASCVTSACDVEMIEYLRGKGVEFNASSIHFAFKGGRMDTVRHLLDFVPCDFETMQILDVLHIAGCACTSEGYEGLHVLKDKSWLKGPIQKMAFAFLFELELPVEVLEIILNGESVSGDVIFPAVLTSIELGRLDLLEHLISYINMNLTEEIIGNALENGDEQIANLLARLA